MKSLLDFFKNKREQVVNVVTNTVSIMEYNVPNHSVMVTDKELQKAANTVSVWIRLEIYSWIQKPNINNYIRISGENQIFEPNDLVLSQIGLCNASVNIGKESQKQMISFPWIDITKGGATEYGAIIVYLEDMTVYARDALEKLDCNLSEGITFKDGKHRNYTPIVKTDPEGDQYIYVHYLTSMPLQVFKHNLSDEIAEFSSSHYYPKELRVLLSPGTTFRITVNINELIIRDSHYTMPFRCNAIEIVE